MTTAVMKSSRRTATEYSAAAEALADRLDARLEATLAEVKQSAVWQQVSDPATPLPLLTAIMREIYLEISSYQPHSTEAVMAMIAKLPKTETKMIRTMFLHQCDEFDHGDMALKDYLALGGDEDHARSRRRSPASLAFDGMWWELFRSESPWTYLGAMFPFEGMTPTFCEDIKGVLESRGLPQESLGFIVFHAKEDIAHRNLIRNLIKEAVTKYPESEAAIEYGADCFLHVFPLPIWEAARQRVLIQHPLDRKSDA